MPKRGRAKSELTGSGPRIREWRRAIPMKSYQLAAKIKISQGSLSDIENGKSDPSAATIKKLYLHTDINISWMLTGQKGDIKEGNIPESYTHQPILEIAAGSSILIKCKI